MFSILLFVMSFDQINAALVHVRHFLLKKTFINPTDPNTSTKSQILKWLPLYLQENSVTNSNIIRKINGSLQDIQDHITPFYQGNLSDVKQSAHFFFVNSSFNSIGLVLILNFLLWETDDRRIALEA